MSGSLPGQFAAPTINGSALGTALMNILCADDIQPGSEVSYQLCKDIYLYHTLGRKIAEAGIEMAMSQQREIVVQDGPNEVVEEFIAERRRLGVDSYIYNAQALARVYGIATVTCLIKEGDPAEPLDLTTIWKQPVFFNVLDPLNTAGSLMLSQDPNAPDFQKPVAVAVQGRAYHPSRCLIVMNERPVYIAYTNSAFGYVGRSCYQRILFPLKSYIQTQRANDMLARKVGVLIAKLKQVGSIIDGLMTRAYALKRRVIKEAETDNVISVGIDEDIASLNLQNADGALSLARNNILNDVAAGVPMPAKLITQETFAEGFGEGTEDANQIIRYVNGVREEMSPLFAFFDRIVQHRAWSPSFYETIQAKYPEQYADKPYAQAFYEWRNSFEANWPNLREEPESEKSKVDQVRVASLIEVLSSFVPLLDPASVATLLQWVADNLNENKSLFTSPLVLDWEAVAAALADKQAQAEAAATGGIAGGGEEPQEQAPRRRPVSKEM
jgi:hypothetical protein